MLIAIDRVASYLAKRDHHVRMTALNFLYESMSNSFEVNLPDDEFAKKMGEFNPQLDVVALHNLLVRLRKPGISEAEMVTLAAEVAKILDARNA